MWPSGRLDVKPSGCVAIWLWPCPAVWSCGRLILKIKFWALHVFLILFLSKTLKSVKLDQKSQKDRKSFHVHVRHSELEEYWPTLGWAEDPKENTFGDQNGESLKNHVLSTTSFAYAFPFKNAQIGQVGPKISKRQQNYKNHTFADIGPLTVAIKNMKPRAARVPKTTFLAFPGAP